MDKVTKDMDQMSLKDVAYAKKQAGGTRGDKVDVKTNLSKMTIKPNVAYFKYDLRMYVLYSRGDKQVERELTKQTRDDFPEQQRKTATVQLWKKLLEKEKGFFGDATSCFYDRAAILFSLKEFKLAQGEEKVIKMAKEAISGFDEADCLGFKITLKRCDTSFQASSNDLLKVVNERPAQQDKTLLEVLNLIVGQKALMDPAKFITYGTGVHYMYDPFAAGFRQNELPDLQDGKYMGVGASKSVKVLEGGPNEKASAYVGVEIKKTAFHADNQPLIEKLQSMSLFRDYRGNSTFSVDNANRNHRSIKDQLKGLYVETTHTKKPRSFRIDGLGEAADRKKFQLEDGSTVTVAAYFAKKYNVKLKYPGLFLIETNRGKDKLFYPVETLRVAGSQRVINSQQTPDQNAITIKACATLPADRLRQTETMKKELGLTKANKQLAEAGVSVDENLAMAPARVLPAPALQMGNKKIVRPVDNCKWQSAGSQFYNPMPIQNWAIIGLLLPNDYRGFDFERYCKLLVERMRSKGMKVGEPEKKKFDRPSEAVVESVFEEARQKKQSFLFFVSSNSVKLHEFIKLTEVKMQILTQEVTVNKCRGVMEKGQNQTLDNVVQKTNSKLGGLSAWVLNGGDPKTQDWISSPTRLFVGFEMSHPAPLSKGEIERGVSYRMPSVLGWGANTGTLAQYWKGGHRYVAARQSDSMGSELRTLIKNLLVETRGNRANKPPMHIVLYFNGISEGQWPLIAGQYLQAIRAGICDLSPQYKPQITCVAVSKEHNERFYQKTITGNRAAEQNIKPGTVVDSTVVSPVVNEFYLNSHSAFQGTAKTPKFSVIYDDSKMPMDVIESMTHCLCYQHGIVDMTVSLPAPLMVADRCAKRGHNVYVAHSSSSTSTGGAIDIERANAELTNADKPLSKVRYNA